MTQGFPVLFISLKKKSSYNFEPVKEKNKEQKKKKTIFQEKIAQNQIWNMAKLWRSQNQYSQKFNALFQTQEYFKSRRLVIIIDQINYLASLCQKSCPSQLQQQFFQTINQLKKRGASIILVSSNPDFEFLRKISGIRMQSEYQIVQVQNQPKKDFSQMFSRLKVPKNIQDQILNYYDSRGRLIPFLQSLLLKKRLTLQKVKLKLKKEKQNALKILQAIINSNKYPDTMLQQVLLKICKQNQFHSKNLIKVKPYLEAQDILFQKQFKSKLIMKAFQQYAQQYMGMNITCNPPSKKQQQFKQIAEKQIQNKVEISNSKKPKREKKMIIQP